MDTIDWSDFTKVALRAGTIVEVHDFPEARNPAYIFIIDFGPYGMRKSSAQVTKLYSQEELVGRQVVAVINFPPKQIGPIMSEVLVTGFKDRDGAIVLIHPERPVPNGAALC